MAKTVRVSTQGISDDWASSTGLFDPVDRGELNQEQVFAALWHASQLTEPAGEDICPPHVMIEGGAGNFSFVGQCGTLFCPEIDEQLRPDEGASLAFGMVREEDLKGSSKTSATRSSIGQAPPPVDRSTVQPAHGTEAEHGDDSQKARRIAGVLGTVAGAALGGGLAGGADAARETAAGAVLGVEGKSPETRTTPKTTRRRFTWRTWLGLFLGGCFLIAGVISIAGIEQATHSSNEEDFWAALIITGALLLIGIGITVLALKSRPRETIGEDGVVAGVAMAHIMNMSDHSDLWDDPHVD